MGASALCLAACLPQLPDFIDYSTEAMLPPTQPLVTMLALSALTAVVWTAFGTEMHPITAKARGAEPPPGVTFQALGLSGPLLASLALAIGWHSAPVVGNAIELAHCALPFVIWQVDVRLLRWLNPHVEWAADATSLTANYRAEHTAPLNAALALLGVCMFEVYVQQLLASGLTLSGWPLLWSAALIAGSAGLVNHALANGILNGILCAEFYWTVSLMFALSNSALPVGIYHHLMYSMPTFVRDYDAAIESAPSPVAHTALLHGTLALWHIAIFAALAALQVPTARALTPAVSDFGKLSLLPQTADAAFGLACAALFGAAAAGVISAAAKAGRDPRAL